MNFMDQLKQKHDNSLTEDEIEAMLEADARQVEHACKHYIESHWVSHRIADAYFDADDETNGHLVESLKQFPGKPNTGDRSTRAFMNYLAKGWEDSKWVDLVIRRAVEYLKADGVSEVWMEKEAIVRGYYDKESLIKILSDRHTEYVIKITLNW